MATPEGTRPDPLLVLAPVAGGRMLARDADGRVVLVAGAIPGERVRVRIERRASSVFFATATEIVEPSPDRRPPAADPACGGALYSHITSTRQCELKSEIIADAFRRIAKSPLETKPAVTPSPEHGYRLRARLHIDAGRAGFFREGTHTICDAGPTGQLSPDSLAAVGDVLAALGSSAAGVRSLVLAENVAGTARVVHLEPRAGAQAAAISPAAGGAWPISARLTGISASVTRGLETELVELAGNVRVIDYLETLPGGPAGVPAVQWQRHASSFFQSNRFLVGALLARVLDQTKGDAIVDLYSGIGLFAVPLAARGARVLAVEGDPSSSSDLIENAAPWHDRLRVLRASVEDAVRRRADSPPSTVILDPPRTGVSDEAMRGLLAWSAPRLVYVSCDPPTLARDAQRLIAGGYRLTHIEAFDFFPNTPHVETLATFER